MGPFWWLKAEQIFNACSYPKKLHQHKLYFTKNPSLLIVINFAFYNFLLGPLLWPKATKLSKIVILTQDFTSRGTKRASKRWPKVIGPLHELKKVPVGGKPSTINKCKLTYT